VEVNLCMYNVDCTLFKAWKQNLRYRHRVDIVLEFFSPPPPFVPGGGGTPSQERGWGVPIQMRGQILWYSKYTYMYTVQCGNVLGTG
jgi:hypothetical protein